jgi:hypothetical protein
MSLLKTYTSVERVSDRRAGSAINAWLWHAEATVKKDPKALSKILQAYGLKEDTLGN